MTPDLALLKRLREKLNDGQRGRIIDHFRRMDGDGDGLVNLADFASALNKLGLRSTPQVTKDLFKRIAGEGRAIDMRELQRHIWGGNSLDNSGKGRMGKQWASVPTLAVERGVKIAPTKCVGRAQNSKFCDDNVYRNIGADRFEFANVEEGETPYYMQGNVRFDCPQTVARRVELLKSGRIARACRQFWDTLKLGPDGIVSKEQYAMVHQLCTRALAPEMEEWEWREACEDDWRDDLARGGESIDDGSAGLTFDLYVLSIFEIADLWTDCVNEVAYIIFINKLWRRVTKPIRRRRKRLWQRSKRAVSAATTIAAGAPLTKVVSPHHSSMASSSGETGSHGAKSSAAAADQMGVGVGGDSEDEIGVCGSDISRRFDAHGFKPSRLIFHDDQNEETIRCHLENTAGSGDDEKVGIDNEGSGEHYGGKGEKGEELESGSEARCFLRPDQVVPFEKEELEQLLKVAEEEVAAVARKKALPRKSSGANRAVGSRRGAGGETHGQGKRGSAKVEEKEYEALSCDGLDKNNASSIGSSAQELCLSKLVSAAPPRSASLTPKHTHLAQPCITTPPEAFAGLQSRPLAASASKGCSSRDTTSPPSASPTLPATAVASEQRESSLALSQQLLAAAAPAHQSAPALLVERHTSQQLSHVSAQRLQPQLPSSTSLQRLPLHDLGPALQRNRASQRPPTVHKAAALSRGTSSLMLGVGSVVLPAASHLHAGKAPGHFASRTVSAQLVPLRRRALGALKPLSAQKPIEALLTTPRRTKHAQGSRPDSAPASPSPQKPRKVHATALHASRMLGDRAQLPFIRGGTGEGISGALPPTGRADSKVIAGEVRPMRHRPISAPLVRDESDLRSRPCVREKVH